MFKSSNDLNNNNMNISPNKSYRTKKSSTSINKIQVSNNNPNIDNERK